ncbi:Acetylornithine deacetylase [Sinorhizobium sp. CCBAU 05631]|nr:Acetylornithine deacetylase [Sinorhizobium sp. CCBAU 05631]
MEFGSFRPAQRDKLYGRGTSDMKGFLTCALAALPKLAGMNLQRPVDLAFSYDEEAGARGVPQLTGHEPLAAVSYGTEAGLYQEAGIDAIICGPGNIDRAHRPNEYIETGELAGCQKMVEDLGKHLAA